MANEILPMPHDRFFKGGLSRPDIAASFLSENLPIQRAERLDFTTLRTLPGSFLDKDFRTRHADQLFEVQAIDGGGAAFIHILLEHQRKPDTFMALRLTGYVTRILEHWRRTHRRARKIPLVLPVIVYQGKIPWSVARSLGELTDWPEHWTAAERRSPLEVAYQVVDVAHLPPKAISGSTPMHLVLQLMQYVALGQGAARLTGPLQTMALLLQEDKDEDVDLVDLCLRYLAATGPGLDFEELIGRVETLTPIESGPISTKLMTIAQQLTRRGRKEGLQEGRKEGAVLIAANLLERRIGSLPPLQKAKLTRLNLGQLESIRGFRSAIARCSGAFA